MCKLPSNPPLIEDPRNGTDVVGAKESAGKIGGGRVLVENVDDAVVGEGGKGGDKSNKEEDKVDEEEVTGEEERKEEKSDEKKKENEGKKEMEEKEKEKDKDEKEEDKEERQEGGREATEEEGGGLEIRGVEEVGEGLVGKTGDSEHEEIDDNIEKEEEKEEGQNTEGKGEEEMDTGWLDKVGSDGDIGQTRSRAPEQNANEVLGGNSDMDEKENDVGEEEEEVEGILVTDDEEESEDVLVTDEEESAGVTDDEDDYAETEDVEDIKSVTEEKNKVIEDDKEDEEKKEEKEDMDDEEGEKNGQDGEGRSEDEIDATAVGAKEATKERPKKKCCEEAKGNVSDEGEAEERGREDSLGGGVVIEQTITVHADGDAVDEALEGRHDVEAEVIDNVDEEVEGVDKGDKGVKEVRREETDVSGTVSIDVSISGRREEGSWRQNSTESNNEEEEEELLDKISLILFSPTSSPITIAVLAALFITSVLGLACIYCRGRRR